MQEQKVPSAETIERRRRAMREQYLPENDAPAEERDLWRKIVWADAQQRFRSRRKS